MDKDASKQIVKVDGRPSEDVESSAREMFSRRAINCEDMSEEQKDRYICSLVDKANALYIDKRAMDLAVEEFQGIHDNVLEKVAALQRSLAEIKAELHEERDRRKQTEAKTLRLN